MIKQKISVFFIIFFIFTISGIGITFSVTKGLLLGTILTIACVLFLFIFTKITNSDTTFQKKKPELGDTETIRLQSTASYQIDTVTIGGFLFLTNERLYFVSHNFLQIPMKVVIPLQEIAEAAAGTCKHQIVLQIHGKKPEYFHLLDRDVWIQRINLEKQAPE